MMPTFVVTRVSAFLAYSFDDPLKLSNEQFTPQIVGVLGQELACDMTPGGMDKLNRELKASGVEAKLFVQEAKRRDGWIGALVCCCVEVENMDDAKKLPGFVTFQEWSGYHQPMPET